MKHRKRLTRRQKIMVKTAGLNPNDYLLIKNLPDKLVLVHREKSTVIEIEKSR